MEFQQTVKAGIKKLIGKATASDGEIFIDISNVKPIHIIKGAGYALLSGILGASGGVFSSYPFGTAFLSATDKYVGCSYFGLIISALFCKGYALPLSVIYTVTLMLRYAVSKLHKTAADDKKNPIMRILTEIGSDGSFGESILIRTAVSCFTAFIFGLYRLIAGGFLYYDLFGLLAGFLISPLTTFALSGLFTKGCDIPRYPEISQGTLMFITVFALRPYTPFGFSIAFIAAFFLTLFSAASLGAPRGCAVGLFAGLACGTADLLIRTADTVLSYSIGAAPCIIAASGLVMGLLWKRSHTFAVAAACTVGLTLGLMADGFSVLPRLLPDIASAAAIYMLPTHFGLLPRLVNRSAVITETSPAELFIVKKREEDISARMNALSEAFSRLSDTVYSLSDRMRRPGVADLKQVCDGAFDKFCAHCSMNTVCLEKECGATLDAQSKITGKLYREGRISVDDVPEFLKNRCHNILSIVDEINLSSAKLIESLIKTDKTEAFALDYEAMSKLLSEQSAYIDAEYKPDAELTAKLRQSLKYMGLPSDNAVCCGNRRKYAVVSGIDPARVKLGADELRLAIENTLETPMAQPCFSIDDDSVTMTLESRRRFAAECVQVSGKKASEKANGDTYAAFENRDDRFYVLISDGMGSGREAAITSRICAMFTERMLSAGNGKAVTLEMLNSFIRSRTDRGGECSATVDLSEIDLITGKACFVKSGAAPSFILRSGSLYKLQSKTVPLGILRQLDAEKIGFDLMAGDVIVMFSDGVCESLEDGIGLVNLLTCQWDDDLSAMADKILESASKGSRRADDITVSLVRISEAPTP